MYNFILFFDPPNVTTGLPRLAQFASDSISQHSPSNSGGQSEIGSVYAGVLGEGMEQSNFAPDFGLRMPPLEPPIQPSSGLTGFVIAAPLTFFPTLTKSLKMGGYFQKFPFSTLPSTHYVSDHLTGNSFINSHPWVFQSCTRFTQPSVFLFIVLIFFLMEN